MKTYTMCCSMMCKTTLVAMLASTLMACGGGGGGGESGSSPPTTQSSTPVADNLSISVARSSVQLDEGDSQPVDFTVNYSGSKTLTYTVDVVGVDEVSATRTNKSVNVNADDVSSVSNRGSITISVTDGTLSATDSFDIDVRNTSFWNTKNDLVDIASNIKQFADSDMSAYNTMLFLTDVDLKVGLLSMGSFDDELNQRVSTIQTGSSELSEGIALIIEELNSFDSESAASEDDLDEISQSIESELSSYIANITGAYERVRSTSTDNRILPAFDFSGLNETDGTYSLFIGNESMGSSVDGTWAFAESYAFLNSVIVSDLCYAL